MEQKIELVCQNGEIGNVEILNKLNVIKKVIEILETEEVTIVNIKYKKRKLAQCDYCTNSNN